MTQTVLTLETGGYKSNIIAIFINLLTINSNIFINHYPSPTNCWKEYLLTFHTQSWFCESETQFHSGQSSIRHIFEPITGQGKDSVLALLHVAWMWGRSFWRSNERRCVDIMWPSCRLWSWWEMTFMAGSIAKTPLMILVQLSEIHCMSALML